MARAEAPRERIGEMLLSIGLITRAQLDDALAAQRTSQLPIGKQLVALGSVSETRLTQVLSNQLSVPWVSLERVEFPSDLLSRIPAEIADRHSMMPIYVRNVRGRGATLYVAMDDPTDEQALQEVAQTAGMAVRPMIAPPSEIRRVIEQRYFGAPISAPANSPDEEQLRPAPERSAKQNATKPEPTKAAKQEATKPEPKSRPRKPPPPPGPSTSRVEGVVAIEQYETPSQPPPPAGRTLTLLDGTQIKLPTPRNLRVPADVRQVRHVVKAIRAARSEFGSDDPLRWHDILQVVLDALDARGVRLTRQEIAEAWRRQQTPRDQPKTQ